MEVAEVGREHMVLWTKPEASQQQQRSPATVRSGRTQDGSDNPSSGIRPQVQIQRQIQFPGQQPDDSFASQIDHQGPYSEGEPAEAGGLSGDAAGASLLRQRFEEKQTREQQSEAEPAGL
jgi:hypothetical protein